VRSQDPNGVDFGRSASATVGTFNVWTPRAFGQSVLGLMGGYMTVGLAGFERIPLLPGPVGLGGALQYLSMGFGRGNANELGGSFGYGNSAGIQLGLSIPLPLGDVVVNPTPDPSR
jgi:hypothetical protein